MATLWLKVSEETNLPETLSAPQRDKLSKIFDGADPTSPWNQALRQVGLEPSAGTEWMRWVSETPYINWSEVVRAVSAGTIEPTPLSETHFTYTSRFRIGRIFRLARIQWKLEKFVIQSLEGPAAAATSSSSAAPNDRLIESLALGLAVLAHTLRLPGHSPDEFARWLSDPASAPANARQTLQRLQALQKKRTDLAEVWRELFADEMRGKARPEPARGFFWEGEVSLGSAGPSLATTLSAQGGAGSSGAAGGKESAAADEASSAKPTASSGANDWKGLPVQASSATAPFVLMNLDSDAPAGHPPPGRILVFQNARPEAVEFYGGAAGVVFCRGGVLSHACIVAREMRLPSVTSLGDAFWQELRKLPGGTCLSVYGAEGIVRILKPSGT